MIWLSFVKRPCWIGLHQRDAMGGGHQKPWTEGEIWTNPFSDHFRTPSYDLYLPKKGAIYKSNCVLSARQDKWYVSGHGNLGSCSRLILMVMMMMMMVFQAKLKWRLYVERKSQQVGQWMEKAETPMIQGKTLFLQKVSKNYPLRPDNQGGIERGGRFATGGRWGDRRLQGFRPGTYGWGSSCNIERSLLTSTCLPSCTFD